MRQRNFVRCCWVSKHFLRAVFEICISDLRPCFWLPVTDDYQLLSIMWWYVLLVFDRGVLLYSVSKLATCMSLKENYSRDYQKWCTWKKCTFLFSKPASFTTTAWGFLKWIARYSGSFLLSFLLSPFYNRSKTEGKWKMRKQLKLCIHFL